MKAVLFNEYGGRDKLILADIPKPQPQEGEVLVRIKAVGVNPVDFKIREGLLKERMPYQFPIILGWDMAGIIEDRSYAARRFEIGEEVYGCCRRLIIHQGTYAEYITIPECYVAYRPQRISFEESAAVPLAGLMAYQGLFDKGNLKKGETVLVVGASGGVGGFVVQLAKIYGATVLAIASRKNHPYLKRLGADETIDYTAGDFREAVKKIKPQGVDLVFAAAGQESLRKAYDCLRKKGRLVTIVERGDEKLAKEKDIELLYHFVEANSKQLDHLRGLIDEKKLQVNTSAAYPLAEVKKAHEQIETFHTQGKIVLTIS